MNDDIEAREEWNNTFGYYPTEDDFPWPYFRDAFYAGKKSKEKQNSLQAKTFLDLLKLEWVAQYDVVISLLEKWVTMTIEPDKEMGELTKDYIQGWNDYHSKFMEKLK